MPGAALDPSYLEAIAILSHARKFGVKPGLASMQQACEQLGHPEKKLRFLHIAGTNGKGSTAALAAATLRSARFRTGLFTSPHLCSLRERIQVDGQMIPREALARHVATSGNLGLPLTFFEILTVTALLHFVELQVDWVVWETGMGGRLDSTNVVTPAVSLITSIGLDHTRHLGQTLSAIAREKAGIIKPGVPVVTAVEAPEALSVIAEVAHSQRSPLTVIPRDLPWELITVTAEKQLCEIGHHTYTLSLQGRHQVRNAACVVAAAEVLEKQGVPVAREHLRRGLAHTRWPGRFQILRDNPPFVLDGAHNTEAVAELLETWRTVFPGVSYHLVFGAVEDKPYAEMARLLASQARHVSLVPVPSERSLPPETLRPLWDNLPVQIFSSLEELWPELETRAEATLLCGSLFLVGQSLSLHDPVTYDTDELRLNERLL